MAVPHALVATLMLFLVGEASSFFYGPSPYAVCHAQCSSARLPAWASGNDNSRDVSNINTNPTINGSSSSARGKYGSLRLGQVSTTLPESGVVGVAVAGASEPKDEEEGSKANGASLTGVPLQQAKQNQQHNWGPYAGVASVLHQGVSSLQDLFVEEPNVSEEEDALRQKDEEKNGNFVGMFRGSAPYIRMHRGAIMVVHIPGEVLDTPFFQPLMDDIVLTSLLGVQLVVVAGSRKQADTLMAKQNMSCKFVGDIRVTDEEALRVCKEAAGFVRFEMERALTRGSRGPSRTGTEVNVCGGNFFSARPIGIDGGVDYGYSGEVRRIEIEKIKKRLAEGDIVQLTCLGFSASGEVFNVETEVLAAECALQLKAAKLIYVTQGQQLRSSHTGAPVQCLRIHDAAQLVSHHVQTTRTGKGSHQGHLEGVPIEPSYGVDGGNTTGSNGAGVNGQAPAAAASAKVVGATLTTREQDMVVVKIGENGVRGEEGDATGSSRITNGNSNGNGDGPPPVVVVPASELGIGKKKSYTDSFMSLLNNCVRALQKGVSRAHIVLPYSGAFLEELFTRDGSGTLITRDVYDGIRPAVEQDIRDILDIIRPLEEQGILVPRGQEVLGKEIRNFFVFTRDEKCVACASLKRYSKDSAEISCLAVENSYRKAGRGDAMLAYLERVAMASGLTTVFVLSTRTMQWFVERGYAEAAVEDLPAERRRTYDHSRKSKIYMKKLTSTRQIDLQEMLWDM